MPVAGAGGIHLVSIPDPALAAELGEDAFRQGRTADIAQADEEDFAAHGRVMEELM